MMRRRILVAAAVRAPLEQEAVRARFAALWIGPTGQGFGKFAAFLRTERAQYAEAVRLAGLQPQ